LRLIDFVSLNSRLESNEEEKKRRVYLEKLVAREELAVGHGLPLRHLHRVRRAHLQCV